jgi:hypothetical protein
MPRPPLFRILLCACLFSGLQRSKAEGTAEAEVWRKLSTYLSKEAQVDLSALPPPEDAASRRERNFCAAVVNLDQQPLTESRLDTVEAQLKALLADDDNDEIGRAARFLLGRMAQIYRAKPDLELAAEYFRGLVEQPGPGRWADGARIKLAVLTLYALPGPTPAERIAMVEAQLAKTEDPITLRDLHRVTARAIMFYNLAPEGALKHLLAADEFGGLTGTPGSDQLVQIGELAWDAGQVDLARKYYERLRVEYPRDARIYLMDERLAGNPVPHRTEVLHGR